jgi:uncharacterized protein YkwD
VSRVAVPARLRLARGFALALALFGVARTVGAAPPSSHAVGLGATPPLVWSASFRSPADPDGGAIDPLTASCGRADLALVRAAARNAGRQLRGEPPLGPDELAYVLRAAGSPHVWPRAWSLEGVDLTDEEVRARLAAWLGPMRIVGERRCGIARMRRRDGVVVVSAVAVDALADLDRLAAIARVDAWIELRAEARVPVTEAKVVLLGPRGRPRTVLASLAGSEIRSAFRVDQAGPWLVQVLATTTHGPRPVLEATIHAGVAPPSVFAEAPAPGEHAGAGLDDASALRAMVNAARAAEGLTPLGADPALDRLAAEHSVHMLEARLVGHDVGQGDPSSRLVAAGISFRVSGENVASAATLPRAHRALWASPSHRSNLLEPKFARLGVGVRRADDGRVWVTELFVE